MENTTSTYTGKLLRVDLNKEQTSEEFLSEDTLRLNIGGVGMGAKLLYKEVPPGIEWDNPENRLILSAGPLNGIRVGGSGTFTVVTKGPLTNGATSSQANGYFGAYLKFSGFDSIIIQGRANRWLYLYIHDGTAELRDASGLRGKDTWETEDLIKKELGKGEHSVSVYCIGPAGENLVKFAAIVGDKGHVAGHNGTGAVMGAKKLKAIAVDRGSGTVAVKDKDKLSVLAKAMLEDFSKAPDYKWGTGWLYSGGHAQGTLPVKNLTANIFPDHGKFMAEAYRNQLELVERRPCWACSANHINILRVKEGPYAGYTGEEPEYEGFAAWSSLIGNTDVNTAFVLSNMTDRLGFEINETGWLLALAIECYEKGLITEKDTGGLKLNWGNTSAVMELLPKIANREGFGDILAEGVKRAAQEIGKGATDIGVYHQKGNAPRGHDHRARWLEILDVATSNTGTLETGAMRVANPFSPDEVAEAAAGIKGIRTFVDSLVMCYLATNTMVFTKIDRLVDMMNAVTGWDYTIEEAKQNGLRTVNLMRAFNIRQGITPEVEVPSTRYSSAPVEGPAQGKSIAPHWGHMLDVYYNKMGWDRVSGRPLPETLKRLELDYVIPDIWQK